MVYLCVHVVIYEWQVTLCFQNSAQVLPSVRVCVLLCEPSIFTNSEMSLNPGSARPDCYHIAAFLFAPSVSGSLILCIYLPVHCPCASPFCVPTPVCASSCMRAVFMRCMQTWKAWHVAVRVCVQPAVCMF